MPNPATTENVWEAIEGELFAILGMVNAKNQARTVGIVYVVQDSKLYIGTGQATWKARYVAANPAVSMTIPIAKRIPFAPWVKIPQATVTFSGRARIISGGEASPDLLRKVFRHKAEDQEFMRDNILIEVVPEGDFLTYGIGLPLIQMREPELARGRAPVK